MAATWQQLKNWFARNIGESDYTSVDSTGEALLNDAEKELSSRFPFECNKVKGQALTISSNTADLPEDFDYSHIGEIKVYSYSGTTKTAYQPKPADDITNYETSEYVFDIDQVNAQLVSNQSSASVKMDYYRIPATKTTDEETTNFPIPKAIALQAAGDYWSDFEEEEDRAQDKYQKADALFTQAVSRNKIGLPPRQMVSKYDNEIDNSILSTRR